MSAKLRYLALGDSYTIGEAVLQEENFPFQAVKMLQSKGWHFSDPEIVAVTGWTTDELLKGIAEANPTGTYDWVTLLIGVNNQYRGHGLDVYREEFEKLLQQALGFAGNRTERVNVLSIPDWGVTPFAEGHDRRKIASDIDAFNEAAQEICKRYAVRFLDITSDTRQNGVDETYLTSDGLHPSGKEYAIWAEKLSQIIENQLEAEGKVL